jgi:hypothetical protein
MTLLIASSKFALVIGANMALTLGLRQHLKRRHEVPINCPKCSQIFQSELQRDEHIYLDTCQKMPRKSWEGVTEFQKRQLAKRSPKQVNTKERWYIIWDILFPGVGRPSTPCKVVMSSDRILANVIRRH